MGHLPIGNVFSRENSKNYTQFQHATNFRPDSNCFLSFSSNHHIVMSSCHHVIMSSCRHAVMSSCHHAVMSSCRHVGLVMIALWFLWFFGACAGFLIQNIVFCEPHHIINIKNLLFTWVSEHPIAKNIGIYSVL